MINAKKSEQQKRLFISRQISVQRKQHKRE